MLLRIHEVTVGCLKEFLDDTSGTQQWRQQVFTPRQGAKARVRVLSGLNRARDHSKRNGSAATRKDYGKIREFGRSWLQSHALESPLTAEVEYFCASKGDLNKVEGDKSVEEYYVTFIDDIDDI